MTEKLEIYKCEICGNIVEVLNPGKGTLVCCGQPMTRIKENTEFNEKHTPVIVGDKVKIGEVPHPMEEDHYIQWIEVISGNRIFRIDLSPHNVPEITLPTKDFDYIRAYCNIHGLWKK